MTLYSSRFTKVWSQPTKDEFLYRGLDRYVMSQHWLYGLKEGLTDSVYSGAWEVLASSAYVGGSTWTADTGDLWTDAESEVVWGASDHAWIVLRSPRSSLGPYYLTLDFTHATDNYRGSIYFSNVQPTLTALSTTVRPTNPGAEWAHTDIILHKDNVSDWRNFRGNLLLGSDGSFVWLGLTDSISTFMSVLVFNVMVRNSIRADDLVGAVSLQWSNRSSVLTSADSIQFQGLHPPTSSQAAMRPVSLGWGSSSYRLEATLNSDFADNTWVAIPAYLWATGGNLAFRGLLEDIFWAPQYLVETTPACSGGVMQAIKVGPFWMPAQESIILH
jgi:hypothetical protein